jgi:hypothetical protein
MCIHSLILVLYHSRPMHILQKQKREASQSLAERNQRHEHHPRHKQPHLGWGAHVAAALRVHYLVHCKVQKAPSGKRLYAYMTTTHTALNVSLHSHTHTLTHSLTRSLT